MPPPLWIWYSFATIEEGLPIFWNADPSIPGPETGDGDILLLLRAVKEVEWSTPNDVTGLHRWGRLLEHALTALYTVRRSHQAGSFLKEISAIVRVICQSLFSQKVKT